MLKFSNLWNGLKSFGFRCRQFVYRGSEGRLGQLKGQALEKNNFVEFSYLWNGVRRRLFVYRGTEGRLGQLKGQTQEGNNFVEVFISLEWLKIFWLLSQAVRLQGDSGQVRSVKGSVHENTNFVEVFISLECMALNLLASATGCSSSGGQWAD